MGGSRTKSKRNRSHVKSRAVSGVLTVLIVVGLCTVSHAVSVKNQFKVPSGKACFLNPFQCKTVYVPTPYSKGSKAGFEKSWTAVKCLPLCPPVVTPSKPRCRTPYRPPWWWHRCGRPYHRGGKPWGRSWSRTCRW
jgi:hypothetical protein